MSMEMEDVGSDEANTKTGHHFEWLAISATAVSLLSYIPLGREKKGYVR